MIEGHNICGRSTVGAPCATATLTAMVRSLLIVVLIGVAAFAALGQSKYDKRPIGKVEINIIGSDAASPLVEEYRLIAREVLGVSYSTPRIRDAIETLYETKRIDTISVTASLDPKGSVVLTFNIKPKTKAEKVTVIVGQSTGDRVTEQDILFRLNLLSPGTTITEQTLRDNADEILAYLRDRGFYRSEVTYEQRPLSNGSQVGVTFRVNPNAQTTVEKFNVDIRGFDKPIPARSLKLRAGGEYSRERLMADVAKIRQILKNEDFLAPELEEPRLTYDSDTNSIAITVMGTAGPKVKVVVETEKEKVGSGTQDRLFPIKREGTLDFAAIVEGDRRLENYYQEQGYFFASVTPVCSTEPPLKDTEGNTIANNTEFLCAFLGGEELLGREIEVKYRVDLNRKLRLTEIRLTGTDKMTVDDIRPILGSQEVNFYAIVPILGYGRGYTSAAILDDDAETIRGLMRELGYANAQVRVNQGVKLNGEDLIITFAVEEGPRSIVTDISITGNKSVPSEDLLALLPDLKGDYFSRAKERNAVRKLREHYANLGFYDARVTSEFSESAPVPNAETRDVKIEFKVTTENRKVVVGRVLVNGNERTKSAAILQAVTLRSGELLKAVDVYSSEQNLYGTDAFSRVEIKPQPAGDTADGDRLTDVIVNVDEQPPRLMTYGGGFSTDLGLSGFFDIRHVNLFGNLWQGGARVRVSQRQQLVQFDFIHPRFLSDGAKRFAPLTLSLQYQRDTTVTRFFRSAFDQGTFGIVQRIDADGNPIDEFGRDAGSPTINRLAFSAETSRTISRKNRSIAFFRYRYEDVRLFNFESLLIKDLLRPDSRTRISGFGATFARDTRRNCVSRYTVLDLIAKGESGEPCRYNAGDPTHGYFLTADYNVSLRPLGANIGFQKVQASANYYYTFPSLKNTTIAARAILGAGRVFSGGDRFNSVQFPSLNGLLPISERFFGGGANTLRGFDFEEAGPRVVIVPQGKFLNSSGEEVFLDPFTIPFGGNALAVINLEARIPLSKSIRAVPFYDGGNVFRRAGDIFRNPSVPPNDVAAQNQRAVWTHTAGLGLRIKTPVGGEFGVDYGRLLNPPVFLIPQSSGPNAQYRLRQDQIHFRFSQAF